MLYVLEGSDGPNAKQLRPQWRALHLERVKSLVAQGRIIIGGPLLPVDSDDPAMTETEGSLIVAEFDSLAQATAWWDADPYVTAGIFSAHRVRILRQVVP
jgi:uncharacterized protein